MVGHALRNNQDYHATDRRQLIEYYLTGYQKLPWHRTPWTLEGAISGAWVATATARRGMNHDLLTEDLGVDSIYNSDEIFIICEGIIASNNKDSLLPYEPDLLGETFFLRFLEDLYDSKSQLKKIKNSFYQILSNCFNGQDAMEFIGFIERLARNLSHDDQKSEITNNYWNVLLRFLNPQHFPEKSVIRWAVSAALLKLYESSRNIDAKYAQKCFDLVDLDTLYDPPLESI